MAATSIPPITKPSNLLCDSKVIGWMHWKVLLLSWGGWTTGEGQENTEFVHRRIPEERHAQQAPGFGSRPAPVRWRNPAAWLRTITPRTAYVARSPKSQ